jgi:hypothetical protein
MSSKLGRIIVVVAPSDDDVFYISATWFLTAGHDDEVIDLAQRPKSRKTHSLRDMERERTYHLLCGPLRRSDFEDIGWRPATKTGQNSSSNCFLLATVAKGLRRRRRRYNHTAPITDDTTHLPPSYIFPSTATRRYSLLFFVFLFPLSVFSPVNISLSSFSGGCAQNLCGGELLFLVPNDELGIGRDG